MSNFLLLLLISFVPYNTCGPYNILKLCIGSAAARAPSSGLICYCKPQILPGIFSPGAFLYSVALEQVQCIMTMYYSMHMFKQNLHIS